MSPHFPIEKYLGLFEDEDINTLIAGITFLEGSSIEPLQQLCDAMKSYLYQHLEKDITPKSIDFFLGLSGKTGKALAVTQFNLKTRDLHLYAAKEILKRKHNCRDRQASELLLEVIKRFEWSEEEFLRKGSRLHSLDDPLKKHITGAYETLKDVPEVSSSLRRICSKLHEIGTLNAPKNNI